MDDALEREEQVVCEPVDLRGRKAAGSLVAKALAAAETVDQLDAATEESISPEVRDLISRCMDGTEPHSREFKPYEPLKFNTQHITMALMRAGGFRVGEIAQVLGTVPSRVSQILWHPYSIQIIRAMMHHQGARVIDIRTRLEEHASEILERMVELTLKEEDLDKVSKVGFGLLDRAGYGTQQKQASPSSAAPSATDSTLARLASALDESKQVDEVIMPTFKSKGPPADAGSRVGSADSPSDRADSDAPPVSGLVSLVSPRREGVA